MAAKDENYSKPPRINKQDLRDATISSALPTAATIAGDIIAPGYGGVLAGAMGSFLAGLVGSMVRPTIEARAADWYQMVEDGLKDLQQRRPELNIEDPATREAFTTTLLGAIPVALRTSQEEKRKVLRNAVLNSTLPKAPDEDKLLIYLRLISDFSPWHLRVLEYFAAPRDYISRYLDNEMVAYLIDWAEDWEQLFYQLHPNPHSDPSAVNQTLVGIDYQARDNFWQYVFPPLADDANFRNTLLRDLYTNSLIHSDKIAGIDYIRLIKYDFKYATTLGLDFLSFVKNPLEE
ncbi:MAG: hypothetical protein M3441_08455 [Chloroflexota bacterium]|nr:hypothetical protein [Chloroflexota bacterium]